MANKTRLIDANVLSNGKFVEPITEWHKGWNDALDAAMSQAPTVDAEPVVHGSWIRGKVNWQMPVCSVCRKQVTAKSNYCPHCGALMDGGV